MTGYLCTATAWGSTFWRVKVLNLGPERAHLETMSKAHLPGKGWVEKGRRFYAPSHSVYTKPLPEGVKTRQIYNTHMMAVMG